MNYWELRKIVSQIIPREQLIIPFKDRVSSAVKEKGRKSNYYQYDVTSLKMEKQERLLNTEEVSSFLEISIRAAACPMPFNLDVWDGLLCIAEGEMIKTCFGDKPVEKVVPGDLVLSMNERTKELEMKEVVSCSSTIKMDLIEIETEMGILTVTLDHPVYTQRGWVPAGNLTEEDLIFTYGME